MSAAVTLSIRGLEIGYGRGPSVVTGLDLSVAPGRCVGIVGANGAGKSSILKCVAGVLRPRNGTIELDGRDVTGKTSWAMARAGLRMVPENRELFGGLSVDMNMRLGAASLPSRERAPALESARALFPVLEEMLDRRASALSGGEQEMLAVARAVAGAPGVVIMDEPTLGLAPTAIRRLSQGIRKLLDNNVTILLAEQNLGLVRELCEEVVAIQLGRIVAAGAAEDVLSESSLRRTFLGA
jgi:branched-chain amino acid transport system ATP-binding protein